MIFFFKVRLNLVCIVCYSELLLDFMFLFLFFIFLFSSKKVWSKRYSNHTITQINTLEIQILKYFFKENKNGMANSMTWSQNRSKLYLRRTVQIIKMWVAKKKITGPAEWA